MSEEQETIPGQLAEIRSRLDKGDARFEKLEKSLAENTEITKDIRDVVVTGRVMTKLTKWIGSIALAISAVWALWHHATSGVQPPMK